MSGRAGRRGLDSTGLVIIACNGDSPPEVRVSSVYSDCTTFFIAVVCKSTDTGESYFLRKIGNRVARDAARQSDETFIPI